MFRVTRPYLNLQVKPGIFFRFSGKYIILCILKGEMPFKIHKIMGSRKKITKEKYVCLNFLPKIFRPVTQNTLIFWGRTVVYYLFRMTRVKFTQHLGLIFGKSLYVCKASHCKFAQAMRGSRKFCQRGSDFDLPPFFFPFFFLVDEGKNKGSKYHNEN